jgi:2-methylcitrate dehydratase PrpD
MKDPDRDGMADASLLAQAATRLAGMTRADLPPLAVESAKDAILDTIGVTLAGAGSESVVAVSRAVSRGFASGPALLFGGSSRADILSAALVNGVASHALDFDDCSNSMGGHPSSPIVPALIALVEERGASGGDFLAAYVAGFEFETRLGRAVNFEHYDKGWHPTATLGTFGCAAACAHLMKLGPEKTATALAFAASSAAGIKANFGTSAKPFHVGQCGRNGLHAALLAEAGATASHAALEHPQGFFAVYNGVGRFQAERLLLDWASPLDIVEPGVAFKQHPCCASTHPAIDALLTLRSRHGIRAEDVMAVRSFTHPRRLRHTDRPDPKSALDGTFSVQYSLARALLHGFVGVEHFTDEGVNDPAVRALMGRIVAAPHPAAKMDTTEHFFADVEVDLTDGRRFSAHVERPLGRDRQHPLPEGALMRKFFSCAGTVLEPETAERLATQLLDLESQSDLRSVFRLLERQERTTSAVGTSG